MNYAQALDLTLLKTLVVGMLSSWMPSLDPLRGLPSLINLDCKVGNAAEQLKPHLIDRDS